MAHSECVSRLRGLVEQCEAYEAQLVVRRRELRGEELELARVSARVKEDQARAEDLVKEKQTISQALQVQGCGERGEERGGEERRKRPGGQGRGGEGEGRRGKGTGGRRERGRDPSSELGDPLPNPHASEAPLPSHM